MWHAEFKAGVGWRFGYVLRVAYDVSGLNSLFSRFGCLMFGYELDFLVVPGSG